MGRTAQRLGVQQPTGGGRTSQRLNPPAQSGGFVSGLKNFGIGALKGAGSTLVGLERLGGKLGGDVIYGGIKKLPFASGSGRPVGDILSQQQITPRGTAQEAGFGTEQIAEFLLPAGKVAKADKALDIALQGSKVLSKFALGAAKVASKSAVEAGVGGGITLAQTGGDFEQAGKAALVFGGTRAATAGIGEALRAFNVPERLYQKIFKDNYKDMISELKSGGINTFAKKHPTTYEEFIKNGIIKTGVGGKPIIDESLAKQALDRGLKGSLRNMSDRVVEDTLRLEDKARKAVKGYTKPVKIDGADKLANVLGDTAERYKNVGNGEISNTALKFSTKLRSQGQLTAEETLDLRRFLDGMRRQSSFDSGGPLSLSQENFKFWSNNVRNKLREIPGLEAIMKDYSFNIDALEALAKEATRRGNAEVIGLLDSVFIGSGVALGEPLTGTAIALARRGARAPIFSTRVGSLIQSPGIKSRLGGETLRGTANQLIFKDKANNPEDGQAY